MAIISLGLEKIPQRTAAMPMLPSDYGQGEIAAKAQQGQTIARGLGGLAELASAYAERNKERDMRADDAAFSLFASDTMTAAQVEAQESGDPVKIRAIYDRAERSIQNYVDGKTNGTPNIKWKDHQQALRDHVTKMKGSIREEAARRVLELYERDTMAKTEQSATRAIEIGDHSEIDKVVGDMNWLTLEERNQTAADAHRSADKLLAMRQVVGIGDMAPEAAATAAEEISSEVLSGKRFPHLGEDERAQVARDAKKMVKVARDAEAARIEEQAFSQLGDVIKMQEELGRMPTESEVLTMFPDPAPGVIEAVRKANKPAQELDQFADIMDRLDDVPAMRSLGRDKAVAMELEIRGIENPDYRAMLLERFKNATTPGKEAASAVEQEITKIINDNKREGTGGMSKKQVADSTALMVDEFHAWLNSGYRTPVEVRDYAKNHPALRQLTEKKQNQGFLRAIYSPSIKSLPFLSSNGYLSDASYGLEVQPEYFELPTTNNIWMDQWTNSQK